MPTIRICSGSLSWKWKFGNLIGSEYSVYCFTAMNTCVPRWVERMIVLNFDLDGSIWKIHVCMYVCMYVCVYIYIHQSLSCPIMCMCACIVHHWLMLSFHLSTFCFNLVPAGPSPGHRKKVVYLNERWNVALRLIARWHIEPYRWEHQLMMELWLW